VILKKNNLSASGHCGYSLRAPKTLATPLVLNLNQDSEVKVRRVTVRDMTRPTTTTVYYSKIYQRIAVRHIHLLFETQSQKHVFAPVTPSSGCAQSHTHTHTPTHTHTHRTVQFVCVMYCKTIYYTKRLSYTIPTCSQTL